MPADAASAAPASVSSANDAVLLFAVGPSTPPTDTSKGLEPLIAALNANPMATITVSGYHSASGDLAQNQELAKQHAFAVRDAVEAGCIAEDRVVMQKPQSAEANMPGEDPKSWRVEVAVK